MAIKNALAAAEHMRRAGLIAVKVYVQHDGGA